MFNLEGECNYPCPVFEIHEEIQGHEGFRGQQFPHSFLDVPDNGLARQ